MASDTVHPAAQPDPLPVPPAAPSTPPSPRAAVSLDDLNTAAAARERDDEDWYTRALLHRSSLAPARATPLSDAQGPPPPPHPRRGASA